jgi:hypothetical protein
MISQTARTPPVDVVVSLKNSLVHAMVAGDVLIEARAQLKHGQWLSWLKSCDISERTAQRYMRLARNRAAVEAKSDTVSDLGVRGALAMLSISRKSKDHTAQLANGVADTAFEWWDQSDVAARERQKDNKARAALFSEIRAVLDKMGRLFKQKPALVEIAEGAAEAKLIDGILDDYRAASAIELGVSRKVRDQMEAEIEALEDAGEPDVAWSVYRKFEHAFGEPGPSQPLTAAVRRWRDVVNAWLQQVEGSTLPLPRRGKAPTARIG